MVRAIKYYNHPLEFEGNWYYHIRCGACDNIHQTDHNVNGNSNYIVTLDNSCITYVHILFFCKMFDKKERCTF